LAKFIAIAGPVVSQFEFRKTLTLQKQLRFATLRPMPFTITWSGPTGAASTRRNTPVDALNWAIEMMGKGFQEVVILDENRKAYSPADFGKFYLTTRT
jgi:hypothetical protein